MEEGVKRAKFAYYEKEIYLWLLKKARGEVMNALNVNAEVIRQLAYIADDEACMRKVLQAIKRITRQKEVLLSANESLPRTKDELLCDFRDSLQAVKDYKAGKVQLKSVDDFIHELSH